MLISSENEKIENGRIFLPLNKDERQAPKLEFLGRKIGNYHYKNDETGYEVNYELFGIPFSTGDAYLIYKTANNLYNFMFYRTWQDLIALQNVENPFFNKYRMDMEYGILEKILKDANQDFTFSLNKFLQTYGS